MSNQAEVSVAPTVEPTYAVRPAVHAGRRRRWLFIGVGVAVAALVVVGAAGPAGLFGQVFGSALVDENVFVVEPTTLNITLKEEGELKAVNSVEIKCEVQGQNVTIQWIVDESTRVNKGDLLVNLASEEMKDRVETEEMELRRIQTAVEEARQALTITRSENASAIKKAEIDLEVAKLELRRYLEGDYEKSRASIEIQIKQTEIDINQKQEDLRKNRELLEKGFATPSKIEELEDALDKAQMTLGLRKLELEILEKYERPKNEMQKRSAAERATEELDREKQRAASREKQALAKAQDQEQTQDLRSRRFERLKEQLAKCEIHAPADGVVQYGESGRRRYWSNNRIGVGERAYDGQTLITLPDTSQMMVTTRIHEADRHKISEGLTCLVRVPAVPGETFVGKLSKIAQFADSEGSWWNPELKEHATEILLEETNAPLSPGDTAHVEILIEEIPDALAVPVQCVFARGAKRFVFAKTGGSAEPVEIELGRSSTTMVEITKGLSAGDRVVMAPDEQLLALLPTPGTEGTELAPEAGS